MAVCLYPSHLISVATHCLECVHVTVHIFMSTLLLILAQAPMDSYIEGWVHLCATVFVSHPPWLCSHTLFRMCTCITLWIYVHLTVHVWSPPPMHSLMETYGTPVWQCVCIPVILFGCPQVSHFCSHTLFRMCACNSTYIYVHLTPCI